MANDPYGASADFNEHYVDSGPPRTSTLAIVSFVLSLMLIIGCFIPGVPAIVTIVSVIALIFVLRSNGRLKGTAFASIALVISILASGFQLALLYGAQRYVQSLSESSRVIEYAQAGDFDAARSLFSPALASEVTDERLASFASSIQNDIGTYQGTPTGLWNYWQESKAIGKVIPQNQTQTVYKYIIDNAFSGSPINLVPSRFDTGPAVTIIFGEPGSNPFNQKLINVIVIDADGDVISLLDSNLNDLLVDEAPPKNQPKYDSDTEQTPADETGKETSEDAPEDSGG